MSRLAVAVAASITGLAAGYWLGTRRRRRSPTFRARRIGAWCVRMASPADAPAIHSLVKQLAVFENSPEQVLVNPFEVNPEPKGSGLTGLTLTLTTRVNPKPGLPPLPVVGRAALLPYALFTATNGANPALSHLLSLGQADGGGDALPPRGGRLRVPLARGKPLVSDLLTA